MPYFVNPAGEIFEADAKDARDLEAQGLKPASSEDITKHNESVAYEQKSLAGKAGDVATAGLQGVARGAMAPGLALQHAITGAMPAPEAGRAESALGESVFGPEAVARKERHPFTAMAGESVPTMLAAAATGGLAAAPEAAAGGAARLGLVPGLAALGGESATFGLSQEAVDAVTEKRDFSARAAGMNGLVNLAFGAVGMGLARGAGRLLGGEAGAAGRVARELGGEGAGAAAEAGATATPTVKRNWLGQIDKGTVPEAPAPGELRSVGAAGGNFDDSAAAKAIRELKDGKVKPGPIAEAAPKMREHLASEGARSLDLIDEVLHDDATLGTKHADFIEGAKAFTPEQIAAQDEFAIGTRAAGEKLANALADTEHAGGLGTAAREEIAKGLQRVAEADTPGERNVALDHYKRGLDSLVNRISRGGGAAVDNLTRDKLVQQVLAHADAVRAGLQDEHVFGANGALQQAENEAHKALIDPLKRIQKRLYEVTGKEFGRTGIGAIERRADPDALLRIFNDPRFGGENFQKDLRDALEAAQMRGEAREGFGTFKLARMPELRRAIEDLKSDFNTAQVLQFAEERAGGGGHGAAGASAGANIAASVAMHGAEAATLSHGFASGRVLRPMQGQLAHNIDSAARKLLRLPEAELAKQGTAMREILDRYAKRVRNVDQLKDAAHEAGLPGPLRSLLRKAGAPIAAGGVAALGAGLAGEGQAGAAELPAQRQNREAVDAQLRALSPAEQAVHARTAEAFARITQQTDVKVRSAVDELFRTATEPAARGRTLPKEQRALDQRAEALGVSRPMARFLGRKTDDPIDAWEAKSRTLSAIMADPTRLAQTMAENLGDLPSHQPEMFTAIVAQATQVASYLHQTMPQASGKSLFDPDGYPPSDSEINEWAGRWVGALHPLEALDDLARNDVLPEQMEAVQAMWPEAYELFQQSALRHIHELGQSGKLVPMDALVQLDSALALGGAGEPLLGPEMASLVRQAESQAGQQKGGAAAPGSPGGPSGASNGGGPPVPIRSKEPARLASASLNSLHAEAGA
jgi:hypothetical protein